MYYLERKQKLNRKVMENYQINIESKNEEFVVLNLTDIQFEYNDIVNTGKFAYFCKTLEYLVNKVKPDLITITGDFTYYGHKKVLVAILDEINKYNIPFAPVLGNHDLSPYNTSINLSNMKQGELFISYSNCLYRQGPRGLLFDSFNNEALGNYIIHVTFNGKLIRNLIMLNSGNYQSYDKDLYKGDKVANYDSYQMLSDEQVDFINKYASEVKSSIYLHMPIFAYNKAINEALKTSLDLFKDHNEYLNYLRSISNEESYNKQIWNKGYENSFGVFHDSAICSSPIDDNVFERISNVDSIITGHDHTNNFVIEYKDVIFAYGLKSSLGCYYDINLIGGTVIKYKDNQKPIIYHEYYKDEMPKVDGEDIPFICDHDYHIHTYLSLCSKDEKQNVDNIVKITKELGLKSIAISDHMWGAEYPSRIPFYFTQGVEHAFSDRPYKEYEGMEIYNSAEIELEYGNRLGLSKTVIDQLDFIVISTGHFHSAVDHFVDLTVKEKADLLCERINYVLNQDLPFKKVGLAHLTTPLLTKCNQDDLFELIGYIGEERYRKIFAKAQSLGVGIEINISPTDYKNEDQLNRILWVYQIALQEGCKFYIGGDEHHPNEFKNRLPFRWEIIKKIGLKEANKFRI